MKKQTNLQLEWCKAISFCLSPQLTSNLMAKRLLLKLFLEHLLGLFLLKNFWNDLLKSLLVKKVIGKAVETVMVLTMGLNDGSDW